LQHENAISFENDKGKREVRKGVHPNHWHGAEMLVQEFVPLIHFHGVDDFLQWMFARIDKEKKRESDMRKGTEEIKAMCNVKRNATDDETKRAIFEQLTGPKSAHKILTEYSTVRLAIINIHKVEDLTNLGITRPASEFTLHILDDPYQANVKKSPKVRTNQQEKNDDLMNRLML
jgi:hypothetical protein